MHGVILLPHTPLVLEQNVIIIVEIMVINNNRVRQCSLAMLKANYGTLIHIFYILIFFWDSLRQHFILVSLSWMNHKTALRTDCRTVSAFLQVVTFEGARLWYFVLINWQVAHSAAQADLGLTGILLSLLDMGHYAQPSCIVLSSSLIAQLWEYKKILFVSSVFIWTSVELSSLSIHVAHHRMCLNDSLSSK